MELPKEIEWNIIKFMSHPVADLVKHQVEDFQSYEFCDKSFADFYFEQYSLDHDCDCCAKSWRDCQCWCGYCWAEYKCCKMSCVDHQREEDDADRERWNRAFPE